MTMAEMMAKAPLHANIIQELIGCDWGYKIWTTADPRPCPEHAARTMVIHAPPGYTPAAMTYKFCDRHFEGAKTETVAHGGSTS